MPPTDVETSHPTTAPKLNPRNNATMFQIFQNVQYNTVQHKKYVKEMIKLYKKLDEDSFKESFRNALHYLFAFGDSSANVDRVIQFIALFCTSLGDEEEFLLFIFEIIFDCQSMSGQAVRYRASQLLAAVLTALGDDASLDDELCDKLLASQMERLQDTRGAVRCRAALALQRLQNPLEPDDEVTRAYRFHMSCDPSSSVRRAILMAMAKTTRNVPFVLERLCDVDEAVRRAAFLFISSMSVTQLRIRQRVLTLKIGLTERSARVRRVVEEILVPSWLSAFQGNITDLLKAIRLDNAQDAKDSQYVAGKLLESLFKRLPISELLEWLPIDKTLRLIPAESLNKETAWYWRHLAEHLMKVDDDETLETILPDLVVFAGYIKAIVESPCPSESDDPVGFSTRQYVLHELGCMLKVYDASDPAGRTALQTLITDVLTGDYGPLSPDVLRAFVYTLELVVPSVSQRMEVISGILTALRDIPEVDIPPPPPPPPVDCPKIKFQRARLRVSLNVAMEAQEEAVRDQNYVLAAECKAKVEDIQRQLEELNMQSAPPPPPEPEPMPTIKEKVSDAVVLRKCLTILNAALDTTQLKTITPMLQMIFDELKLEIFKNPEILETALETVALYGMLDKEFAQQNKGFFFVNLMDTSNESTVKVVLCCIVDLLCFHGARLFEDDSESTMKQDESTRSNKKRSTFCDMDATDQSNLSESAMPLSQSHSIVIELLLKIMDSDCAAYRLIIVEGLCRLLYLGHLESSTILSKLLLLWFNPATVDEDKLRQTIGVFFQTFPISVDGAQEQIQKATLPTLRALANAPSSSPLSEIDQEAVVKFIVSLTRVNHELLDSQGGMAMVLCQQLVRRPVAPEAGLACRMLALLSPPRDAHLASELATTLKDLITKLTDKQSCRYLTKYLGALEAFEMASLNKMSHTGMGESTIPEDTMTIGRITTSLPQPIARSTHVVVNETIKEDIEISDTSPTEVASETKEDNLRVESSSFKSSEQSSETESISVQHRDVHSDSSSDVSPVKKAKITKGKKKKSFAKRKSNSSDTNKPNKRNEEISENEEQKTKKKKNKQEIAKVSEEEGGIKRTRSQRSLDNVETGKKTKTKSKTTKEPISQPQSLSPSSDLDCSNVTIRRSTRGRQSGSESSGSKKASSENEKEEGLSTQRKTRSSSGSARNIAGPSRRSVADNTVDDTVLHTIVYEKEFEQEILDDSSELVDSKQISKTNITIPETPDASEESDSEPEPIPQKARRKAKK